MAAASIEHLLAQSIPLEIIVVDNSEKSTVAQSLFPGGAPANITLVHEPRPGIPIARNAALDAARALQCSYIAFLDDDEIPPRTWIEGLLAVLRAEAADVVQGQLIRVPTLEEGIDRAANHTPGVPTIRVRRTAATNNVLFTASLLEPPFSLRFDEELAAVGGSDTEFFMRAADAGAKIVRTTEPPVFEVWDKSRMTTAYVAMRAWRVGASTNYRYRKNRHPLIAAGILTARAVTQSILSVFQGLQAVAYFPVSAEKSHERFRRGVASLCFAAGCLSPYVALRPRRYY